jgi:nucleotide-binding universal stress UspA family protein
LILIEPICYHARARRWAEEILGSAETELSSFCDALFSDIDHEVIMCTGSAYRETKSSISELKIDLVIMGTRGTGGLDHFFFGSTAERDSGALRARS